MYRILKEHLEAISPELTALTRDLVAESSPSLDEEPVAVRVEQAMRRLGFRRVLRDDYGNVLALQLGRGSGPTVLLNSHLDTVAAPVTGAATEGAGEDAGWIRGCGASDCKGGLAAQIYAAALLQRSLLPLKGHLVVAATVAEENGLSLGVRGLMSQTLPGLGLKADLAILGEPTGLGLFHGHDGWMEFDVRIEGASPFVVEDLAQAAEAEALAMASGRAGMGGGRENLRVLGRPQVSQAAAGPTALLPMACRLGTDDDAAGMMTRVCGQIRERTAGLGSASVEVAVRHEDQRLYTGRRSVVSRVTRAWETSAFHPLLDRARQALEAAGCEARPGKWRLGRLGMGTAGSVLVNEFQVPTFGYGPGEEVLAHAPDERVAIARVIEAAYGTAAMVHGVIGIPVCGWTSDEI